MRDERTDNASFRAALRELTQMLVYEATRHLALAEEPIRTPVTATTGYRLPAPPPTVAGAPARPREAARRPRDGRHRARDAAGVPDGLRRAGAQRGDVPARGLHGLAPGVPGRPRG